MNCETLRVNYGTQSKNNYNVPRGTISIFEYKNLVPGTKSKSITFGIFCNYCISVLVASYTVSKWNTITHCVTLYNVYK